MIDLHQIARLLGGRIRTLRKKMGLKQSQFAQMVGMSRDAIGLIERGEKLPRLESICKIADKLNIPLSRILDFDKTMQEEKKQERDPFTLSKANVLSSFNLYLKTKSPQEVRLVHDLAKGIFNKAPSIYQKTGRPYGTPSGRKQFIMRDK
jgi:transcriptional regulator with XRE-family HTH domain